MDLLRTAVESMPEKEIEGPRVILGPLALAEFARRIREGAGGLTVGEIAVIAVRMTEQGVCVQLPAASYAVEILKAERAKRYGTN